MGKRKGGLPQPPKSSIFLVMFLFDVKVDTDGARFDWISQRNKFNLAHFHLTWNEIAIYFCDKIIRCLKLKAFRCFSLNLTWLLDRCNVLVRMPSHHCLHT